MVELVRKYRDRVHLLDLLHLARSTHAVKCREPFRHT